MSLISFRCCTKFNLIQTQERESEREKKEARCFAKGFIIYYLQLANLIVRLTQLLAAKIEAQIARMPYAAKEREQLGNFWLALRGSLLFCVLSEYSDAVIKFTSCSTV